MAEAKSSIELYSAFARGLSYRRVTLEKSDIEQLLGFISYELIISNCSPLFDAAYSSCRLFFSNHRISMYRFEPTSFTFSDSNRRNEIPAFDAWWIIILLSEYMPGGSISKDIDRLLPYFFGNYMPKNPNAGDFLRALQSIDAEIQLHRKKMYKLYVSKADDNIIESSPRDTGPVADRNNTEVTTSSVTAATEKEKDAILSAARKQAEEEHQRIVGAAHEEAERIIQRASFEAEKKVSNARKKHAEILEESRMQSAFVEQQLLQQGFSDVRTALLQANEMIKNLEDTVSESSIKKLTTQLLELFNLIADSKESAFDLARQNRDQDLENMAYNMDVFLDMIIEYMVEYGIKPIVSSPGDKFSSKYHTTGVSNQQFDPRSTSVKASRRTGFLWGEQVLQKEQVEI